MDVAIGVGHDLGLDDEERLDLVREAARLGYVAAWTNAAGLEAVETCRRWNEATGLATGISALPTPGLDLGALATAARAVARQSGGRHVLGIGAGRIQSASWRARHGLGDATALATMREHVLRLKAEAGVPVYLAALGPKMLELAGEVADGVLPNWMDEAQLAWARERIAAGARAGGREPQRIRVAQYIRVAVDDDPAAARRALARAVLSYGLAQPSLPQGGPYRVAFARMGFGAELGTLEERRARGAGPDELADAASDALLDRFGAWGPPDAALARARALAKGLDLAIVRLVLARPGVESGRAVVRACAPALWS